jgi:protease-4
LPNTITGSIGVISGKVVLGELYDKIGLDKEVLTRGRYADLYGLTRKFDDDERAVVRHQMAQAYERFVGLVAEGRMLTVDSVDAIGQGRVWSGMAAKENGLVDRDADLAEAIIMAARMADIKSGTTIRVRQLPQSRWRLVDSRWFTQATALPGIQSLATGLGYALERVGLNEESLWYEMPHLIVVQ